MSLSALAGPTIIGIQVGESGPSDEIHIVENGAAGRIIGEIVLGNADPDQIYTITIMKPEDPTQAVPFQFKVVPQVVDGSTKYFLSLWDGFTLDHEDQSAHSFVLTVTDANGGSVSQHIAVTVEDVNEAPLATFIGVGSNGLDTTITVLEGGEAGREIGGIYTADFDFGQTCTYELVQADGTTPDTESPFEIAPWGPDYYRLKLKDGVTLSAGDYEHGTFTAHIRTTDSGTPALSRIDEITVRVTDHDEPPTGIQLYGSGILSEATPAGGFVGYLHATDPNGDPITDFTIQGGDDLFEAVKDDASDTWILKLKDGKAVDYETAAQHVLHITVTAGGLTSAVEDIVIDVTNVDDNAPGGITLNGDAIMDLREDARVGDLVGTLSATDRDGDAITGYALSQPDDTFELVRTPDGAWHVQLKAGIDYEAATEREHVLHITAAAGGVISAVQEIAIHVTNVDDNPPSGITLDGGIEMSLGEDTQAGYFLGVLAATDADGDLVTGYALAEDSAFFEIVHNVDDLWWVKLKAGLDHEAAAQHVLQITATANGVTSAPQAIVIHVDNVDDNAPGGIRLDGDIVVSLAEDAAVGTVLGILSATDADGDLFNSFNLIVNSDFFAIERSGSNWVVKLQAGVDYEAASQHVLQITATANGVTSAVQDITINLGNVDDNAPGAIAINGGTAADLSEGAPVGTVVGILSATDADGDAITSFTLADGSDYFEIVQNGTAWEVRLKARVDYETATQQPLSVTATAHGVTCAVQYLAINVTNADDAPGDIQLNGGIEASLREDAHVGAVIGFLSAVDVDRDAISGFALAEDSDLFEIVQDGTRWAVQLKAGVDYETATQHVLHITAIANGVTSAVQAITINVTDADDAPGGIRLNGAVEVSIAENSLVGAVLGTLSAADADGDAITGYTLAENSDFFELARNGTTWEVRLKAGIDFETAAQHVLHIAATSATLNSAVQDIVVNVTDADDAPGAITLDGDTVVDLDENASIGSVVGVLSAVDADGDAITGYALAQPSALFEIVRNGTDWVVRLKAGVDFEAAVQHTLHVTATANGLGSTAQDIVINLTDADDAPSGIQLNGGTDISVVEEAIIGDVVGTLTSTDPNGDTITSYDLTEDNAFFEIAQNGIGDWQLRLKARVDYENAAHRHHILHIASTASGMTSVVQAITVNVTDVNEAPTAIDFGAAGDVSTTVLNTAAAGHVIDTLRTLDPDQGDTHAYAIVTDHDSNTVSTNSAFGINAAGQLVVHDAGALALLAGNQTLWIRSTDLNGNGLPVWQQVTVAVSNPPANHGPTAITLTKVSVAENAAAGTEVGALRALDPDFGDRLTFSLKTNDGGAFAIKDGRLVVADGSKLDFEAHALHQVKVEARDAGGLTFEQILTINLTDGTDTFRGTSGKDRLVGTAGADIFYAGAGKDTLTGSTGRDVFVFDTAVKKGQYDTITDFAPKDDTIEISLAAIKSFKLKGIKAGVLNKKFFVTGDHAKDGNDYFSYNKKNGFVYLDKDGSGPSHGIEIVKLKPNLTLHADDFLFV